MQGQNGFESAAVVRFHSGLQMDTARQTDWKDVFKACIKNFKANVDRQDAQHKTGLISDFLLYKSTSGLDAYIYEIPDGKVLEKEPQDAYYFYNACRF